MPEPDPVDAPGDHHPVRRTAWRVTIVVLATYFVVVAMADEGASAAIAFFTIQSNIAVAAYFAYAVVRSRGSSGPANPAPWVKGCVTVGSLLTGIVYHSVLNPGPDPFVAPFDGQGDAVRDGANLVLHAVVPLLTLGDWLLFGPRGIWSRRDTVTWLAFPGVYLAFVLARGGLFPDAHPRYPYAFVDPTDFGVVGVLAAAAMISVIVVALGTALVLADGRLDARAGRHRPVDVGIHGPSDPI